MRRFPILLGAVLALSAQAAEPPASAGLRAYRDPATGRLLPAPASAEHEAIAHAALGHRDDALMREEVVPGHGVLLHANGQLRMSSVVKRDADGHFVESCVTSAAEPEPEPAR